MKSTWYRSCLGHSWAIVTLSFFVFASCLAVPVSAEDPVPSFVTTTVTPTHIKSVLTHNGRTLTIFDVKRGFGIDVPQQWPPSPYLFLRKIQDPPYENGCPLIIDYEINLVYDKNGAELGFDVVFTVTNETEHALKRPRFNLERVRVMENDDDKFYFLDGRHFGRVEERIKRTVDNNVRIATFNFSRDYEYPGDLYAPVLAYWNTNYGFAMGLSLIYDVMGEKHYIRGRMHRRDPHYIQIGFDLHYEHPRSRKIADPGHVLQPPNSSSTYRVAVRFAPVTEQVPEQVDDPVYEPVDGSEWLATLEPYREFFVERYGRVRYRRDLRPEYGESCALFKHINPATNPFGYAPSRRIDSVGWGPLVDYLRGPTTMIPNNFSRLMVWAPSGLYQVGQNYPVEFMTNWRDVMEASIGDLLDLKQTDGVSTVGMWWGHAPNVSGGWNTGLMWPLDIHNLQDRQASFNELDKAVELGIDSVGLDAWTNMALWDRYEWLQTLIQKYPGLKFRTETSECDIMHTLAPGQVRFTYQRGDVGDESWRKGKPVLADFLVPGHETALKIRAGYTNDDTIRLAAFNDIVAWKCVPLLMSIGVPHDPADFIEAPEVRNVAIEGRLAVGETLTGTYTYWGDAPEGASTYRWLSAETEDGQFTAIDGATDITYTLLSGDAGAFIRFEVTPVDTANPANTGEAEASAPYGPVFGLTNWNTGIVWQKSPQLGRRLWFGLGFHIGSDGRPQVGGEYSNTAAQVLWSDTPLSGGWGEPGSARHSYSMTTDVRNGHMARMPNGNLIFVWDGLHDSGVNPKRIGYAIYDAGAEAPA